MFEDCDVIVILPVYGHFVAIWILVSWSITLTFSLTVTFYLTKTESRTKKSLTQLSHYCFE